jgi:predicted transcriptional regulator YdeE
MTPRMTTRATFSVLGVAGCIGRGSESPELFARIWKTFESRRQDIESMATQKSYVGVSFPTDDERVTEYVAGMRIAADTPAPEGLETRTVQGGEYAVFECQVAAIGATYQHAFSVWLPKAAVQFDNRRAAFEEYPENTPEQPVRLYIPVRQHPAGGERAG